MDQLLADCEDGHSKLRHVEEEFEEIAQAAYVELGEPEVTIQNAWTIFRLMIERLQNV